MEFTIAHGYEPHEKQRLFHNSGERFSVVAAGIRGGKTKAGTVEFLRRIFRDVKAGKARNVQGGVGRHRVPRLLYWVVGPTFNLTKYVYDYIVEFVPRGLIESISGTDRSIWLKGGILIQFWSTERPERLVGASVNGMLIDEACRCKAEAWKGSLRGRLADTKGWAIFTSSPLGGKSNWLYQEVVLKHGQHGYASFHWTTAENTAVPELLAEVEHARATQAPAWFRREYEASWDSFGGSIYDEFSDANIVSESSFRMQYGLGSAPWSPDLCKRIFRRVYCGVDWGYTSPGSIVAIGHLGDNQFVVLEESYASNRSILGHGTTWLSEATRLRNKYGVSQFACDPSQPSAINDFVTNHIPAVGAYNDIYLGIRRVAEAVHPVDGRPGLRILDQCSHLIGEMRSYMWKSTRDGGGFTETPADGQSDHACDALRYGIVELRPVATSSRYEPRSSHRPIG